MILFSSEIPRSKCRNQAIALKIPGHGSMSVMAILQQFTVPHQS
jgi:hypothetical protein